MLLIIHNLPSNTRYADVKSLIKDKCGLTEMIVDNLVSEGKSKKVTVGLADEGDAAILVRKLNGLYVWNQQLFVENVRQKKTSDQPYQPNPIPNQYQKEQFNQCPQPQFDKQFFGQQNAAQFQPPPLMSMESQSSCPPAPNFGVPFYMTAQNQNVDNNVQYMVQYPKVQGSVGNESRKGRDIGYNQQYSHDSQRGISRKRSPKRLSKWNDPDYDKSDGRKDRDRSAHRDDRHDADHSYKDKYNRDSFQSRSHSLDYGSNKEKNIRFDKSSSRPEPQSERLDRSTFGEQNEYRCNDNKNVNIQDGRYIKDKDPQRFRENDYSQSSGSDYASRSGDSCRKRPYDSSEKSKYGSQEKKFGSNQQFNSRYQEGISDNSFVNDYQNKKDPYLNKSQIRASMQQIRSTMQPKMPHMQSIRPQMQSNRPQVQSNRPQMQSNRPQMQSNRPQMQSNMRQIHPKSIQNYKPQWQPKKQSMKFPNKQVNFLKVRPSPIQSKQPNQDMIARHEAWRVQAAAVIATQIVNNVGRMHNKRDPVLIKLKACVRARIDVITGEDMSINLNDMLSKYREKFQDDDAFYNAVLEKVENCGENKFETRNKASDPSDIKPKHQFIGKPPAKVPSYGESSKLPKYPDGDKKVLRQMKQAQKDELINDALYTLDANQEKALEEELNKFEELIKQELRNPGNDTQKSVSTFMKDVFVPDFRKVLTLHIKKRILDVRTTLSVRVICHYKAPKRNLLDNFLMNYGVVSLKASDKNRNVFVAICDSYENYDALCKQGSTIIDDLKISFKPLNITGPPMKTFKKRTAKTFSTENKNGNNNKASTNQEITGNDVKESKDNIGSNAEDSHPKEVLECEIIPINKSEDVVSIQDNVGNNVIVIDDKDVDVNEKDVTDLEKAAAVTEDKESANNELSATVDDEGGTVDNEKPAVTNDTKVMEYENDIIDNANIVDDDLEDF